MHHFKSLSCSKTKVTSIYSYKKKLSQTSKSGFCIEGGHKGDLNCWYADLWNHTHKYVGKKALNMLENHGPIEFGFL